MKKRIIVEAPIALRTQAEKTIQLPLEAFWTFDGTGHGICHWRVKSAAQAGSVQAQTLS